MKKLIFLFISLSLSAALSNPVFATKSDGPNVFLNEFINARSYSIDEILKINALTASCPTTDNPLSTQDLKITRYTVATVPKDGNPEAFFGAGNLFSAKFKECLRMLRSGDRIVIRDIYYKSSTGAAGECNEVVIYIK